MVDEQAAKPEVAAFLKLLTQADAMWTADSGRLNIPSYENLKMQIARGWPLIKDFADHYEDVLAEGTLAGRPEQ